MALRELRIDDMVVIERACVEPGEGFSVLTGETGSGKSVSINALRLAIGHRVDGDPVRPGAKRARVVAVFDNIPDAISERLDAAGVDVVDDFLTLTREMPATGRSVCRINGALVAQTLMREIGDELVEVTAQGASQRLLQRIWQRRRLDAAGGQALAAASQALAAAVRAWREASEALAAAQRLESSSADEVARAREVVNDLQPLELQDGEDQLLVAERLRLRNAAAIVASTQRIHALTRGGDDPGAADLLADAAAAVDLHAAALPELADLANTAGDLVEQLRDLGTAAQRIRDGISGDPQRLEVVETRLDLLAKAVRRYGSISGALETLEAAHAVVEAVDGSLSPIANLLTAVTARSSEVAALAAELSRQRRSAARRLERAVNSEMAALEMPEARFRVVLTVLADPAGVEVEGAMVRCGRDGIDEVEFRLATGNDGVPVPLGEGPSGGELSRLALAISAAIDGGDATTLVLDEVDTGVGGETAARVGDMLARIGQHRQVIAITHRSEIAARAGTHVLITRDPGTSLSHVDVVAGASRIDEVARLMSGRVTAAARLRATELLEEAAETPVRLQAAPGN